jgi:hypothetical protein
MYDVIRVWSWPFPAPNLGFLYLTDAITDRYHGSIQSHRLKVLAVKSRVLEVREFSTGIDRRRGCAAELLSPEGASH